MYSYIYKINNCIHTYIYIYIYIIYIHSHLFIYLLVYLLVCISPIRYVREAVLESPISAFQSKAQWPARTLHSGSSLWHGVYASNFRLYGSGSIPPGYKTTLLLRLNCWSSATGKALRNLSLQLGSQYKSVGGCFVYAGVVRELCGRLQTDVGPPV